MMNCSRRAVMGGAWAAGVAFTARAATPSSPLPVDAFAERPALRELSLSPDGRMVLARIQVKGEEMLGTYVLSTGELKSFAMPKGADLGWYRWAGSDRFLVSVSTPVDQRELVDGWMSFNAYGRMTRLLAFDLKTGAASIVGFKKQGPVGDDLLYVDPAGKYLLLSLRRYMMGAVSVYRVDLITGATTLLVPDQTDVYAWYVDDAGVVRASRGWRDNKWFINYRSGPDAPFRLLASGADRIFERDMFADMTLVAGSDKGYVLAAGENGLLAAHSYDFAKKALGERLFACPTNDVETVLFDPVQHKLQGYAYTDDRYRVSWVDPLYEDLQKGVDRGLPGQDNHIVGRSDDGEVFLIHSGTSGDRGRYYIFHLSNSKLTQLLDLTGKLPPSEMATTRPVNYPARDGLVIPAYLTLPRDRPATKLPLVIMPHGGPFDVRDVLGFDAEVQMLANRGYAVLQPNYRGSGTYGVAFVKRGEGEWGRKMQDDLDDGMDWLVKQGIVDPSRACLVGSSYGGYAAAWGATRNPERYRCAACFAGVFDLREQIGFAPTFLGNKKDTQFLSAVKGDSGFSLDSVSPLKQISKLRVPVLLVHGEEDLVVPIKQSRAYDAALKGAGKAHEFYAIKDEGHGFRYQRNNAFYLAKLDEFLRKHNPA